MVVQILDIVPSCDSNDQGDRVRAVIISRINKNDAVMLDFSGVTNVTSSFVNSAFVELLPDYDFDFIKSRIQIRKANRQIGQMIKTRMRKEAEISVGAAL